MTNKHFTVSTSILKSKRVVGKQKQCKEALSNVKFIGPSVFGPDGYFRLVASGTGEVEYGVPSFIK